MKEPTPKGEWWQRQRHRGLVKLREGIEAMLWEKAAQGGYQAAV